jgi:hypothetical protein
MDEPIAAKLAWRVEADYFAMFFAVAAAIVIVEAAHRSLLIDQAEP